MTQEQNYLAAWMVWGITTLAGVVLGFRTGGIDGALGALVTAGAISSIVLAAAARAGSPSNNERK